jgi:ribonuclease HI
MLMEPLVVILDQAVLAFIFYIIKRLSLGEYLALLIGVFLVKKEGKPGDTIHVFSDSLLLVKQMTGEYRVKKPELQVLHRLIKEHATPFGCTFEHVYRENNVQADALANAGIDTKTQLPLSFISLLRANEIHI